MPKFQLSGDNSTYYYLNNNVWTAASAESLSQSSTITELYSNISNFPVAGNLYFKAFLPSDGSYSCSISNIEVTKDAY